MKKVHVEIWSDYVCPWCWIAKRRFEQAVASLAGQVEVVVTNKAYRLAKGMAPMDYQTALYQKLGGVSRRSWAKASMTVTDGRRMLRRRISSIRIAAMRDGWVT